MGTINPTANWLLIPMVCKTGCGRMAAIMRLLTVGSCPEVMTEEDTNEKIASQTIRKEFYDADEANLLEEEDMHVFDCRPLVDPLHLVCCNACKKPVKASQYAAHAERCKSLNYTKDLVLELDGGSGCKKPPRKGRKIPQATNGTSASVDHTIVLDASEIDIGGRGHHKIPNAGTEVPGNALNRYQKSKIPNAGTEMPSNALNRYQKSKEYLRRNAPVPLATKIYHLQGNNHLRLELGHLYREACAEKHGASDSLMPELMKDKGMMSRQVSPSSKLLHERDMYSLAAVWNHDQMLAHSSELFLGTSGGLPSGGSFPNHFREDSFSKPEVVGALLGMMKTTYHSARYAYPVNSGLALGTMQKTNGSVPVVYLSIDWF
ncbi:uncharacterized protein [Elaeis guineensis]|uniref:Uncharacterized protein LOC105059946 isoform X1 n=2 Tax=Elaeis guineensis var. tenera TaxID=51953 RepID=A0A6I9SES2_ELAGV|nr:uncharacterized protein LOC105059946 isoform X1 [Elaeis guineensis]XP_010941782.1 uncharacterized protein LOC105059946 isoform X1 [Elaeis guineensis]XP_029116258.1 uncharacterized protein LOC105059946 isoform X1 [Elaeis guineensis]